MRIGAEIEIGRVNTGEKMKKSLWVGAFGLLASVNAFSAENPCVQAASEASEWEFETVPDLHPDFRQPKGSGTYQFVILKDGCYFDVSVEMTKTSKTKCSVKSDPVLDEDSANCG
jgi:hypothetical protein